MLIAHFGRTRGNVGISTGQLYCVNTFGAAIGCVAVGFVMLDFLALDQVIDLAAAANVLVATSAWWRFEACRVRREMAGNRSATDS
jgi:hypothetical protein